MTSVYHLRICSSTLSPALLPARSGDRDICYLTMYKKVWSVLATKQITQWERGSNSLLVVTVARETTSLYSVWQQPQVFSFLFFCIFCQCHRSEVCSEAWRSKFIMKQTTSQIEVIKTQKRKNSGYQLPWCFKFVNEAKGDVSAERGRIWVGSRLSLLKQVQGCTGFWQYAMFSSTDSLTSAVYKRRGRILNIPANMIKERRGSLSWWQTRLQDEAWASEMKICFPRLDILC